MFKTLAAIAVAGVTLAACATDLTGSAGEPRLSSPIILGHLLVKFLVRVGAC